MAGLRATNEIQAALEADDQVALARVDSGNKV